MMLYAKDSRNKIRQWEITATDYGYRVEHGLVNGELQTKEIDVTPKSNRTFKEQVELEINSQIKLKKDKGYVESIEAARNKQRVNSMGLLRPMLAKPFAGIDSLISDDKKFIQYKYNGHRCLITNQNGKLIAYSRNGKPIHSVGHVLNELHLNNGETIDGELYVHMMELQTITSLVKREQEESKKLSFIAYDYISDDTYSVRLKMLERIIKQDNNHSCIAPTGGFIGFSDVDSALDNAINKGYEGLILRLDKTPYESGKRSNGLIKVKKFIDDDFKVINITLSKDGHAILHCFAKNGWGFKVSAPGNHNQRIHVAMNINDYIGRIVNIKYANLTKTGIPFHPIATTWRIDK